MSAWEDFIMRVCRLYEVSQKEEAIFLAKFPDENTVRTNAQVAARSTENDRLPWNTETIDKHLRTIYEKLIKPKKPNCEAFPNHSQKRGQARDPELQAWLKQKYLEEMKPQGSQPPSRSASVIDGGSSAIPDNPFIPLTGIVDEPQQFFNRHREIRSVFETLNTGSSVALIGEEGIGKSSLLWEICRLAESRLLSSRQPVYLDLNPVWDENGFYSALCEKIGIPDSKGNDLNRHLSSHRVLLAIDNVGKIVREGFTWHIRDWLRGIAEGSDAPLKLIVAAGEPLDVLFNDSQNDGKTSPLAGICQEENIKPWDEATIRAFIQSRLDGTSVSFTEEEISRLLRESAGHPRRLVRLCYQTYAGYMEKLQ